MNIQSNTIELFPSRNSSLAIHALTALCATGGVILIIAFVMHARERQRLHLVDRPGTTIGAVGAMLSHTSGPSARQSGHPDLFLDLLRPQDTIKDVKAKLENKQFRLNPNTGALEMRGDVTDEMYPLAPWSDEDDLSMY